MHLISRKLILALCPLAAALALSACGGSESDQSLVELPNDSIPARQAVIRGVEIQRNGMITPRLNVRYETFSATPLAELREQEHLDSVVAAGADEFGKMLALKEWVSAQWPQGNPNPYPPWNAIEILDWIRSGITGGFCAQYSQVLLQSLASLGWTARYVEIGSTSNPYAHFVVEVWSNQFDKWVLLDADYNVHFERAGIPLSALEIHDAVVNSQLSDVRAMPGEIRSGHSNPDSWPFKTAELYYYLRFHLKANHLSAPSEPPFDRWNDMIEWNDSVTVPWEQSTVESQYPKVRLTNASTSDRSLVAGALNQVQVSVDSWTSKEIIVSLQNNLLEFDRYQARFTDIYAQSGEWMDLSGSTYVWRPPIRRRAFEVRGVNSRGIPGPSSLVVADVERGRTE